MLGELICPGCGTGLEALACQCRGYIRNAEAHKAGVWDKRALDLSLGGKITTTDVDILIERHGYFLLYETKGPRVPVPEGQCIALEQLSFESFITVVVLWGKPDEPESFQQVIKGEWKPAVDFSAEAWWAYTRRWFEWADGKKPRNPDVRHPLRPIRKLEPVAI